MFAAVSFLEPEEGNTPRAILQRLWPGRPALYKLTAENVSLFLIQAPLNRKDAPDWGAIVFLAAQTGISRLLLPPQPKIPEKYEKLACLPYSYQKHYCVRIARRLAHLSRVPLPSLSAAVLDPNGYDAGELAIKAFPFFRSLILFTVNGAGLPYVQERAVNELGRKLEVCSDDEALAGCDVVFAPYGVEGVAPENFPEAVLISARPLPENWSGPAVDGFEPGIPPDIDRLRPDPIGKLDFAAALWQHGGIAPMGMLPIERLFCRGREIDGDEIRLGGDASGTV